MMEGSPNFPHTFLHSQPPLHARGWGWDLGEKQRKKRAARKQQLLCLIEQRSEKEFRNSNSLWHGIFWAGGLAAVSWDFTDRRIFDSVDGQMNSHGRHRKAARPDGNHSLSLILIFFFFRRSEFPNSLKMFQCILRYYFSDAFLHLLLVRVFLCVNVMFPPYFGKKRLVCSFPSFFLFFPLFSFFLPFFLFFLPFLPFILPSSFSLSPFLPSFSLFLFLSACFLSFSPPVVQLLTFSLHFPNTER